MLDRYKLFTGLLAFILGLVMLVRLLAMGGGTTAGYLLSLAFIGFGAVRLKILFDLIAGRPGRLTRMTRRS
jgi:hypothetical protein